MINKILVPFFIIIFLVVGIVLGVNYYLTPDSLANCGDQPDDGKSDCQQADAIVAVSGGDTNSRAKRAINLFKQGWAPIIIFSGDSADPKAESNAEVMRKLALSEGVPDSAIHIDSDSKNTRENAINTSKIINKIGAKDVILVSSPYHLRRVKLNFSRYGGSIKLRTTAAQDNNWNNWYLTPKGWLLALSELGGIIRIGTVK